MAGPPRRLAIDFAGFVAHVESLVAVHPYAIFDLRADAYGLGMDNVRPVFDRLGVDVLSDNGPGSVARAGIDRAEFTDNYSGVIPGDEVLGLSNGGTGFARLTGTVVKVKRVPAGRRISYGYTYATTETSTVALIALGYADGVVRRASNLAPVQIGTHTGLVAGRIAMDQFVADMRDALVTPGDTAVLFGNPERGEPSIATWSEVTGVPALAIMSGLGPRIARVNALPVGATQ